MELHTSNNPARELGEAISAAIREHNGDVVVLLSGGSALDVVEHLDVCPCRECRTTEGTSSGIVANQKFCSLPECRTTEGTSSGIVANQKFCSLPECRTTGSTSSGHSRLTPPCRECRTIFMMGDERWSREQEVNNTLQLRVRYPDHLVTKHLLETIPGEDESLEDFATRIEKTFLEKISTLRDPKIFMILGMGADGHTAGIFPLSNESFQEAYRADSTYVPVHVKGLTIDSRASFSPSWILSHVDQIFGYVVGEPKHAILESLVSESKELHERPAELLKLHKDSHIYTNLHLKAL